jgi:predicted O-methyltransferase YrrM
MRKFFNFLEIIVTFIKRKALFLIYSSLYNEKKELKKQNILFKKFRLDREKAVNFLNQIKKKFNINNKTMSSEHEILFSALSIKENKIKKILEIGTYDGSNSFLLSKLFPNATIETMDLKDNDYKFINSYNRENSLIHKKFLRERQININLEKRIKFIKKNSIKLIFCKKKYDLIWVDGDHGYPTVTIDIVNSLRLAKKKGYILIDDIFLRKIRHFDSMYDSIGGYETLQQLKNEKIIDFTLISKRLDKQNNCIPFFKKYIAIIHKINKIN